MYVKKVIQSRTSIKKRSYKIKVTKFVIFVINEPKLAFYVKFSNYK